MVSNSIGLMTKVPYQFFQKILCCHQMIFYLYHSMFQQDDRDHEKSPFLFDEQSQDFDSMICKINELILVFCLIASLFNNNITLGATFLRLKLDVDI